jgi:hypothetical protein
LPAQASQRRHSSYNHHRQQHATSAVHNQRVAQLLALSTVNANRTANNNNNNNNNNNQFYASSAPSSTVALNKQSRPALPPVPLFNQSSGSVPQAAKMMNAADVDLGGLDDFTAFEGGASTAYSSPAISTGFDFPGSISSSVSNMGTVSPQDLLVQSPFLSAPNSAALTALTSPSNYDSPDFDGFDVSPNYGSTDFENSSDNWYSLFPQETSAPGQQSMESSPVQRAEDIDSADAAAIGSGRRKSNSPTSGRHSSVSGVNARKRDKPLPPIVIEDPHDVVAMKRARNTLAARKSRERKAQRFEDLEERIAKLEAERDHWKKIALAQSGANAL